MGRILGRGWVPLVAVALVLGVTACGNETTDDSTADSGSQTATAAQSTGSSTTAAAATAEAVSLDRKPSGTDQLCGDKPIKLGYADGFGANSWRKTTLAELKDEVSVCPNVEVTYTDAGGDVQKYNTQVNSFVAKGYDAILTFDDFGSQGLPALRNAYKAGVAVVPFMSDPGGKPGEDYTAFIAEDYQFITKTWADWLAKLMGDKQAHVIYMGGTPGNPLSTAWSQSLVKDLQPHSNLQMLSDKPVDTNWDPAQYQRVMSGLIAKYPDLNAIASDYGTASVAGIRAYANANKPHPPLMTDSTSNELGCEWLKYRKKWPEFQMIWLDGSTQNVRYAARRALASVNDLPDNDPDVTRRFVGVDTTAGKLPKCEPDLPPDADLSGGLTTEQLKQLFS